MIEQKNNHSQELKGAIVGFGYISSKGHLPAYLERMKSTRDIKIVAICDSCPERKKYVPDGIKFYSDFQQLISNEELDFIDVSTHAADHYMVAKHALLNNLHVLCEKPLTTTIEEAVDLIKTAISKERVLFPCHNYKYAPVVREIQTIVESGLIGKIRAVSLSTFRNTHALGCSEWKPDWRRYKQYSGGGIAMDHGSHSFYLIFQWLGGYPKNVTATSQNFSFPKFDTEDNFSAVLEFDEGIANVNLSWTAGVRKVIYAIQGEKGAITVVDDDIEIAVMKNFNNDSSYKAIWETKKYNIESHWMDSSHVQWFNAMFDQFMEAIVNHDYRNREIIDSFYAIQSIKKSYVSISNNSVKTDLKSIDSFF